MTDWQKHNQLPPSEIPAPSFVRKEVKDEPEKKFNLVDEF